MCFFIALGYLISSKFTYLQYSNRETKIGELLVTIGGRGIGLLEELNPEKGYCCLQ